jgi:hypothetical protein
MLLRLFPLLLLVHHNNTPFFPYRQPATRLSLNVSSPLQCLTPSTPSWTISPTHPQTPRPTTLQCLTPSIPLWTTSPTQSLRPALPPQPWKRTEEGRLHSTLLSPRPRSAPVRRKGRGRRVYGAAVCRLIYVCLRDKISVRGFAKD